MKCRCIIGFFGVTRGLEWTIDSIERNVYAPLTEAGITQVRLAHFNRPDFIRSPRSEEAQVPFKMGDLHRLELDQMIIEPQIEANISKYVPIIMNLPQKGEEDVGGFTRRNALHQLYSLRRLGVLIENWSSEPYDMIVLLRPDLRYLDPLPVDQILAQINVLRRQDRHSEPESYRLNRTADLIVPAWQKHGGLNDRLAIATPAAARIYCGRLDRLALYCAQSPHFQTERFLAYAVSQARLRIRYTRVRAERIRSDGSVKREDFSWGWRARMKWGTNKIGEVLRRRSVL